MSGHHISTDKILLSTAVTLFALTLLTVGAHYIHLSHPYAIIVALAIAVVKATLVALFFMNLYWDLKFNSMLLITSLVFLGLLVSLSLLDTLFRAEPVPGF